MFGVFAGAWAVATVDIERTFHLTDTGLGALLAAGIIAATAVAAIGGAITDRFGRGSFADASRSWSGERSSCWRRRLRISCCSYPRFMLAMAAGGLVDVVMNIVAADALAHDAGRLVRFHGLFNGGCVAGAAVTGVALRLGASWRVVWVGVAIVGVVTGIVTRRARAPGTGAVRPSVDVARARRACATKVCSSSRSCSARRRWSRAASRRGASSISAGTSASACSRA